MNSEPKSGRRPAPTGIAPSTVAFPRLSLTCPWLRNAIFPSPLELQSLGQQEVQHTASYLKSRLLDWALTKPIRRQPVGEVSATFTRGTSVAVSPSLEGDCERSPLRFGVIAPHGDIRERGRSNLDRAVSPVNMPEDMQLRFDLHDPLPEHWAARVRGTGIFTVQNPVWRPVSDQDVGTCANLLVDSPAVRDAAEAESSSIESGDRGPPNS
jgi:hypothetical protein